MKKLLVALFATLLVILPSCGWCRKGCHKPCDSCGDTTQVSGTVRATRTGRSVRPVNRNVLPRTY